MHEMRGAMMKTTGFVDEPWTRCYTYDEKNKHRTQSALALIRLYIHH